MNNVKFVWLCFFLIGVLLPAKAVTFSKSDSLILNAFGEYALKKGLAEKPLSQRIDLIGRFFLGCPYQSGTLNVVKEEMPVINLRELDCVTYVENVLALAFLESYDSITTDRFIARIIQLRYRYGEIEDYTSRLHYSLDWLYEMSRIHYLNDVTQQLGGLPYFPGVGFMSVHPEKYPALAADKKLVGKIQNIETAINKRPYYYIPKARIGGMTDKIQRGDIILITTSIKGLDTSHLGIAVKKGGKTHLMHASSSAGKVVISAEPLEVYMGGIKSQTGIIIARPHCFPGEEWLEMP